jgi:transposase-like protein
LREEKTSIRRVAAAYGIPSSTLHAQYRRISKERFSGPSTVLTHEEEREIVQTCIFLEMGIPLERESLINEAQD